MNSASDSVALPDKGGRTSRLVRGVLYGGVVVSAAVVAYVCYGAVQDRASLKHSQDRMMAHIGLTQPVPKRLAPGYVDADGGLVADLPSGQEKLMDPKEIVVAYYDGDEDEERVDWDGFCAQLSKVTGRKVTGKMYLNSAEDAEAIKAGKLHVVAVHAADTPYLVNNSGFVPVAVLGTDAKASGNHLVIAVGPKSKVTSLAEVRGKMLTCTRPDSITGYRAAIAVLSYQAGLLPEVDYHFHFSHGQSRSIRGLVDGDFEIAALSADKLQSMLASGSIKSSDYRVIYESQVIPRLTIGYVYNLQPQLAAQVTKCALEFDNALPSGGSTEGRMRFFAIDYRKDFAFARKIDASFDPRIRSVRSSAP